MAQYLVLFNNYTDITTFDGSNDNCLFIGPIVVISTGGKVKISPMGKEMGEVMTDLSTTDLNPFNYRVGKNFFRSFIIFSEDVPFMKRFILTAQNNSRVYSYSEYGFLNNIKFSSQVTTIAMMVPNSKKVLSYLTDKCPKKALGQINPAHEVILIVKRFDSYKKEYIIMAHSVKEAEDCREMLETYEAWFDYINEEEKIFPDDAVNSLEHDAFYALDQIAVPE